MNWQLQRTHARGVELQSMKVVEQRSMQVAEPTNIRVALAVVIAKNLMFIQRLVYIDC